MYHVTVKLFYLANNSRYPKLCQTKVALAIPYLLHRNHISPFYTGFLESNNKILKLRVNKNIQEFLGKIKGVYK